MLALFLDALALLTSLGWAGGLLVLGAIVAPTIFRSGDPYAADLMTQVFLRFDRLALVLALGLVLGEATVLAFRPPPRRSLRILRPVLAVGLGLCITIQARLLSPRIAELHATGVHRGTGSAGVQMDRIHRASSGLGQVGFALATGLAISVLRSRRDLDEVV